MKKLAIAAVVVGMIGLVALGAVVSPGISRAFAQGPTPGATPGPYGYGSMMGWMYGNGLGADWHAQMQGALAKGLGMSVDDLNAQLRQGKTVAQIAQSKEISLTKLRDDVHAAEQAFVQQAVKDGRLTQAQADSIIQHIDAMSNYWDANGGGCPGWTGTAGYGFGPGGMMGGLGTGVPAPGTTNGNWRGRGGMTLAPHAPLGPAEDRGIVDPAILSGIVDPAILSGIVDPAGSSGTSAGVGGFRGSMMGAYGPWATPTPSK